MVKGSKMKKEEGKTLIQWLIGQIDGNAYRAGHLSGKKHFKVDEKLLRTLGGRESLLSQAREIQKDPVLGKSEKIAFQWRDMNGDIQVIHCAVDSMPELCRREGIEDPRARQLRYIRVLKGWQEKSEDSWLSGYYGDEIRKLEEGHCSKTTQENLEDGQLYRCLDALIHLEEPVEKPIFSARVFRKVKLPEENLTPSKIFRKKYESRVISILKNYSPEYAEGMSDDELLAAHSVLSYAQTLEWKGALIYSLPRNARSEGVCIDEPADRRMFDTEAEINSAQNLYGTMINAQTLEQAVPRALPGVRRVYIIENKANYEKLKFREDELYIFCHGFFSPKEVRFLKNIEMAADPGTEYYHWGDMDYGGIRIFQFNKSHIFPGLKPYKMNRETYERAVAAGAGVPIEDGKRRKLEKLDAGELKELQACILERGLEIEQELLAE